MLKAEPGEMLYSFVTRLRKCVRQNKKNQVTGYFNEVEITCFEASCEDDLIEKYHLQSEVRRLKSRLARMTCPGG